MKIFSVLMAVYFTIGACIPRCDFSQLLKLEDLVNHYELHKNESTHVDQAYDLLSFLYEHFVTQDDHHHEESGHENLPYQSLNIQSFNLVNILPTCAMKLSSNKTLKMVFSWQENLIDLDVISKVFHPPVV